MAGKVGDVHVKITGDAQPIITELHKTKEALGSTKIEFDKMKDVSFDKATDSLKSINVEMNNLKNNMGSGFDGGGQGVSKINEEVKQLSYSLLEMNPELEAFKKRLQLLTMNKLNKELYAAEMEFEKLSSKLRELEAQLANSNDAEWVAAIRQQMREFIPDADNAAMKINLVEEQIKNLQGQNLDGVTDAVERFGHISDKAMKGVNRSFKKGLRQIKRFAVGLIGLRTFWALLTRSMRTYIKSNDEFNSKIQGLLQGIAQIFAPLAELAVKALSTIIRWLAIALAYIFTFINAIFGTNIAISALTNNMKDLTKETKAAAAAAKGSLAPFDELNTLNDNASSGASVTPYVAPDFSAFDISEQMASVEKFKTLLENNAGAIKLVVFALIGLIVGLLAMATVLKTISFLTTPLTAVFVAIAILIGTAMWIASLWDTLSTGQKVALIMLGLVVALAAVTAGIWFFNAAVTANPIGLLIIGIAAVIALLAYIIVYWDDLVAGFKLGVSTMIQWFKDLGVKLSVVWSSVVTWFNNGLTNIITWFKTKWNEAKAITSIVVEFIKSKWNAFYTSIKTIFTNIGLWFSNVWNGMKTKAGGIVDWLKTKWDTFTSGFKSGINAVGTIFSNIWNGIKTTFSNVWDWIMKKFNKGGEIFSGIGDGIASVFKSVVNGLISGINVIIAAPFRTINGLMNKVRSFSIFGAEPFKGMWSYNPLPIPKIPQLAHGAITTGDVVARIGEGKYNEAVIPLGQSPEFKDMQQTIADAVIQGMAGNSSSTEPIQVNLYLDDILTGHALINTINRTSRLTGKTVY